MKRYIPVMIFVLLIILLAPAGAYGRISLQEREALQALYNKTNGRNWLQQKNWNQAPGTEPTWQGITCDAANTTVLKIELPGNRLQGVFPVDLQVFANLTTLDLSNNRLTGAIPRWIESFKNLKKLDLGNNEFSGPIPAWIGSLKNLEELVLDNNKLDGAIPKELAHPGNLKVLRLAGNRLTGEIPAELVRLVNLEDNRSDFRWNGLSTRETDLKEFLRSKQTGGDWESTQTTSPSGIEAVESTEGTITIRWHTIPYTAGNGGYRVFYREEGKSYDGKFVEDVTGKTVADVSLTGLKKSTLYNFKICTWTGSHSNNKNRIDSSFGDERSMATRGIIISGVIINKKDGKGFPGVLLTVSNGGGTATTNKDGIYRLSVMPGWNGTVTPFRQGFAFSPPFRNYDKEVTKNTSGNNYTVEAGTAISGTVNYKRKGIGDVILKFNGEKGNYTALTDENGNYQQEVSYNWSGTVTPIKERYGFDPGEKRYENVTSSLENQSYDVRLPKIFGRVKVLGGKGIGGVKLKFSNVETDKFSYLKDYAVTDDKGNYENGVLENWEGRVSLESSKGSKYLFYPRFIDIESMEDARKAQNYKAMRNFKCFIFLNCKILYACTYYDLDNYKAYIYPGLTLGYKFAGKFYIYIGTDFFSKHVKSNFWGEPTMIKQSFYLGIGSFYYFGVLALKWNVGMMGLRFQKDTGVLEDKISFNSWGGSCGISFILNINDRCFLEFPFDFFLFNHGLFGSTIGFGMGYRF
jgi:Leucine-rich repeat (LRR) protein